MRLLRRSPFMWGVALALSTGVVVAAGLHSLARGDVRATGRVTVPDVVGLSRSDAVPRSGRAAYRSLPVRRAGGPSRASRRSLVRPFPQAARSSFGRAAVSRRRDTAGLVHALTSFPLTTPGDVAPDNTGGAAQCGLDPTSAHVKGSARGSARCRVGGDCRRSGARDRGDAARTRLRSCRSCRRRVVGA